MSPIREAVRKLSALGSAEHFRTTGEGNGVEGDGSAPSRVLFAEADVEVARTGPRPYDDAETQ